MFVVLSFGRLTLLFLHLANNNSKARAAVQLVKLELIFPICIYGSQPQE